MSVVTGFLLTFVSISLKDRQLANIAFDKQKKILKSLDLFDFSKDFEKKDILDIYHTKVKNLFLKTDGRLVKEKVDETDLPIFVVYNGDKVERYAVYFEAYGLWSTMKGYMGLKGDGENVIGFTVFEHAETPGLGAEVEKDWFANQFIGKKITNSNHHFVSIGIEKGGAKNKYSGNDLKNHIDAISGSTITSKGLERDLKKELEKYEIFSSSLRR
jgi:Na+-transporting NADH:ubiquinone oxidoreductase subunit C